MISLRPARFDELGLRWGLTDRMLPLLVAAMAFLAALALAGWFVRQQQGRTGDHRPSDGDTLLLPARECGGADIEVAG